MSSSASSPAGLEGMLLGAGARLSSGDSGSFGVELPLSPQGTPEPLAIGGLGV